MGKPKAPSCLWEEEIQGLGMVSALLDRLRFHRNLSVSMVAECTGRSERTAQKHMQRLVDSGRARWDPAFPTHLQIVDHDRRERSTL